MDYQDGKLYVYDGASQTFQEPAEGPKPLKLKASEVDHFENYCEGLEELLDVLVEARNELKPGAGGEKIVFGSITIENDLEAEDEESEDESDDEE